MKKILLCLLLILGLMSPSLVLAQNRQNTPQQVLESTDSSQESSPSSSEKEKLEKLKEEDITKPEEERQREEFLALFSTRQIDKLTPLNFMGYLVQYSVKAGVPANTVILILLLPFLATLIVFIRQIIGLPSLEMLVPIALSITLISTGLTAGGILLITILLASTIARITLKKIRIMQLPKIALSILVVAIFVFISLTVSASIGILAVKQLSIFPVLLLILLSEKTVAVQLSLGPREAFLITFMTLLLGLAGYIILSSETLRSFVLLYPEVILALVPVNIIMGRYFGLRLTEFYRFSTLRKYANQ